MSLQNVLAIRFISPTHDSIFSRRSPAVICVLFSLISTNFPRFSRFSSGDFCFIFVCAFYDKFFRSFFLYKTKISSYLREAFSHFLLLQFFTFEEVELACLPRGARRWMFAHPRQTFTKLLRAKLVQNYTQTSNKESFPLAKAGQAEALKSWSFSGLWRLWAWERLLLKEVYHWATQDSHLYLWGSPELLLTTWKSSPRAFHILWMWRVLQNLKHFSSYTRKNSVSTHNPGQPHQKTKRFCFSTKVLPFFSWTRKAIYRNLLSRETSSTTFWLLGLQNTECNTWIPMTK